MPDPAVEERQSRNSEAMECLLGGVDDYLIREYDRGKADAIGE